MYKQGSIGKSILDGMEGRGSSVSPWQWGVALGGTLEEVMQGLKDLCTTGYNR